MSVIPVTYMQFNWFFTGSAAPTGAQVTLGALAALDSAPAATRAETAYDFWRDELLPLQTVDINLVSCLCKLGPNDTGQSGTFDLIEAGGGGTSDETPAGALLVQKLTTLGGRAGKGRMYVPGIDNGDTETGGGINPTSLANWQTAFDAFYDRFTATDWAPVVLHSVGSPISTPTPIVSFSVQGTMATQRQRLRR